MKKKNLKNNSCRFKIRWQFIAIIIPVTLTAVGIVLSVGTVTIFRHLERNSNQFYRQMILQVSNNLDFVYEQYAMTMVDITMMDNFKLLMNAPDFSDINEEKEAYSSRIILESGFQPEGGSIRRAVMSRIDGDFIILDLDRFSYRTGKPFVEHNFTYSSVSFEYEALISDPLVQSVLAGHSRMSFGKLNPEAMTGFEADLKPVMIYSYTKPGSDKPGILMIISLQKKFLSRFYDDLTKLNQGTLYITDMNGSILSRNHPGDDDYYSFDVEEGRYILEADDDLKDPSTGLSFYQYGLLNVDPEIMELPEVTDMIERAENDTISGIVTDRIKYQGISYMVIHLAGSESNISYTYFYPVQFVRSPLYRLFLFIAVSSLVMALVIAAFSFFVSSLITSPIQKLSDATVAIAEGNLETKIDCKASNEIGILADNFRIMAEKIKDNTKKLEDANVRLKNLDKIKSLFFNSISHQLRTPLFHIVGFSTQVIQDVYNPNPDIEENNQEIIKIFNRLDEGVIDDQTAEEIILFLEEIDTWVLKGQGHFFDLFYQLMMKQASRLPDAVKEKVEKIMLNSRGLYYEYVDNLDLAHTTIDRAGNDMVDLIETFSRIATLDAAVNEVNLKPVSVSELIDELENDTRTMLAGSDKSDQIALDFRGLQSSNSIVVDRFKIKTVLRNLLQNAVLFTESGSISLKIDKAFENDQPFLIFTVTDTGIGIREEEKSIIFSEFGKTSDAVHLPGIGLGLTLSKRIMQLLGGDITFDSEYGSGTVFRVTVPVNE
jgi:signal transduction histidine kinase